MHVVFVGQVTSVVSSASILSPYVISILLDKAILKFKDDKNVTRCLGIRPDAEV